MPAIQCARLVSQPLLAASVPWQESQVRVPTSWKRRINKAGHVWHRCRHCTIAGIAEQRCASVSSVSGACVAGWLAGSDECLSSMYLGGRSHLVLPNPVELAARQLERSKAITSRAKCARLGGDGQTCRRRDGQPPHGGALKPSP